MTAASFDGMRLLVFTPTSSITTFQDKNAQSFLAQSEAISKNAQSVEFKIDPVEKSAKIKIQAPKNTDHETKARPLCPPHCHCLGKGIDVMTKC